MQLYFQFFFFFKICIPIIVFRHNLTNVVKVIASLHVNNITFKFNSKIPHKKMKIYTPKSQIQILFSTSIFISL